MKSNTSRKLSDFFGMGQRILKEYGLKESRTDVDKAISKAIMLRIRRVKTN